MANDVSGRQWQFDNFNGGQWVRSKSFDTFLPLSSEVSVNLGKRLLFNSPVGRPDQKQEFALFCVLRVGKVCIPFHQGGTCRTSA